MPADDRPHRASAAAAASGAEQAPSDDRSCLDQLLEEIRRRHGESLLAILVYGSWLRGKRDTMLDFYVLVEDYRGLDARWQGLVCRLLPPNVYQIHHRSTDNTPECRAKYALLTLDRFGYAMRKDFHSYFWARFAQPCEVLYARDERCRAILDEAFAAAATQFMRRAVPAMADRFSSEELWTRGLALTYACELRTESGDRGESIYRFASEHYDGLTRRFAEQDKQLIQEEQAGLYSNLCKPGARRFNKLGWWLRRIQGKLLSFLRLTKASLTFNDSLDYLLWKIRRHTGIYIEPSSRQRRYPLLFAWPLLWKLYRRGAFR